ncbi:GNAT family N-acetyltransferase [Cellulophaga sp. Hel_I_12]|uniref:GNAT family N-acetyltransferase n=1 Tax=Cellulophaga sp. Hel_I_12 TaxID=1249972 RepID=UPI000648EB76|nr:GNAT family N-acetyltransferase [Cellulophaga sp. Hel_I_12]
MINIKKITAVETYPLRHAVLWPEQPISYIQLAEDTKGIHFGLFKNKQLVSVISLFIDGESAQFRKFATHTEEQGRGYGTDLLQHTIDFATTENIKLLWCNARADKTNFYKKFGFKETSKTYIKKGVKFIILEKVLHRS